MFVQGDVHGKSPLNRHLGIFFMFSNYQASKSKLAGGCTGETMKTTGFASNPSFGHLLARVFREWVSLWQFGLEKILVLKS